MHKKIYIREAQKVSFKRINNYLLEDSLIFAFIVECEGRYFDFVTGEEYQKIEYRGNIIVNDIFENTFYIRNIEPYPYAKEDSFKQAIEVFKYNEYLDELKKQKKLIVFPQRKIN